MSENTQNAPRVEAIDRAMQLLDDLSEAGDEGSSLAEICSRVKMNKSTAYRALATMRQRGYVRQDTDSGNYSLGYAALTLPNRYFSGNVLARSMHPALLALSRETDELVHLGVMSGDRVVYLDKVEPTRAIRVWSDVGRSVPVATTSLGRAILAFTAVERQQLGVYLHAPHTSEADQDQLWTMIEKTRSHGFSYEIEENEPGVACLGVPLLRGELVIGALSITTFARSFTNARRRELLTSVVNVLPPLLPEDIQLPGRLINLIQNA